MIRVVVDPAPSNNLQCGTNGLFAATAAVQAGDGIAVTGDGASATPYVVAAALFGVGNSLLGGGPPAGDSGRWLEQEGTSVGTTDSGGHLNVSFPVAFPTGVLDITYSLGDFPTSRVLHSLDLASGSLGLDHFHVVFVDASTGAPIIGNSFRINWRARGWQ